MPPSSEQLNDADRAILRDLLELYGTALPAFEEFRLRHESERSRIDRLLEQQLIAREASGHLALTIDGFLSVATDDEVLALDRFLTGLQSAYRERLGKRWTAAELAERVGGLTAAQAASYLALLSELPIARSRQASPEGFADSISLAEAVIDEPSLRSRRLFEGVGPEGSLLLESLEVDGYRALVGFRAEFRPLTVIVGANATGKSSLLGVLALMRGATEPPFPPELDPTLPPGASVFTLGQQRPAVSNDIIVQHPDREELESLLTSVIPGFVSVSTVIRGKGRATISWRETGVPEELTAPDLSDGTLRLLSLLTLAVAPRVPSLVCIDEPELGLHPRVFPVLAAAVRKLSTRTQVVVTTHAPEWRT